MKTPLLDKEKLLNSRTFCMMPWIHTHVWPNGNAYACCYIHRKESLGNLKEQTLAEIWNSEGYKELRLNMLNDIPSESCRRCYDLEENTNTYTLRKSVNYDFAKDFSLVEETLPDGSHPTPHMKYLDVRWSNLCNFKCRSCSPWLSSSWHDDYVRVFGPNDHDRVISLRESSTFWNDFEPFLEEIEEVNFAGGEALFMDEHYAILNHWIRTGRTNVRLRYTTNFSVVEYKGQSVFDLWKHFSDVRISASLDGSGSRGEYIREGMSWKKIVENRERMLKICPHIYFEVTPTISVFNVLTFPGFHRELIESGFIQPDRIRINLLTFPAYQSIQVLPMQLKKEVLQTYLAHERWLRETFASHELQEALPGLQSVRDYLMLEHHQDLVPTFLKITDDLDKVRHQSFDLTFPELSSLRRPSR